VRQGGADERASAGTAWILGQVVRGRLRRSQAARLLGTSSHDQFEGRSSRCTLLVCTDDATSELMALRLVPGETTHGYMQTLPECRLVPELL